MKTLIQPENEAEANALKAVLKEQGIHAEIRSFHDTAYDGLFQAHMGWGVIRVSEEDAARAGKIIEEWYDAAPGDIPWNGDSADE